jgi:EAL domain-containing protein (putative c-di-GMP-specific phosphodiesterase class I)
VTFRTYGESVGIPLGVAVDGERRAVIVGVNRCSGDSTVPDLRFAEADALAVHEILTDPLVGSFDPDDVALLVGGNATADAVMEALRDAVLPGKPNDVLLVYFAGHGLVSPWDHGGDPYLVTADFDSAGLRLHPGRGLRMRALRQDVFERFDGASFLVLDCCYAGGYAGRDRSGDGPESLQHALENYEPQLTKHTALLACPPNATTREPAELRHGVLTHHLLEALRGEAAGSDGCVSFADATNYVKQQKTLPPVGVFARDWGPTTVLTRPVGTREPAGRAVADRPPETKTVALGNPLDRALGAVTRLLDRVFRSAELPYESSARLELVHRALAADATAVVQLDPAGARVREDVGRFPRDGLPALASRLASTENRDRHAELGHIQVGPDGRPTLAVRLQYDSDAGTTCLVVVNPDTEFAAVGEPLAIVLRALMKSQQQARDEAEVDALTELRKVVGRLPLALYERCFETYRRVLDSMVMVFEPVVSIDRSDRNVGVDSYEALARRDGQAVSAPGQMLDAAHFWGDRFIIERDSTLAHKAIHSYALAHDEGPWHDLPPRPLSVNVAVRALLSDAYASQLEKALDGANIASRVVTLEISESDRIQAAPDESWLPDPDAFFRSRLAELSAKLGVTFAVDDFGAGYASLNRLSTLPLTQIKVDRTILQHPAEVTRKELELVVHIASHAMRRGDTPVARGVVVEGVDDDASVSLAEIYQSRIHLVQGHVNEMPASPRLAAPSPELRNRIAARVRGEG